MWICYKEFGLIPSFMLPMPPRKSKEQLLQIEKDLMAAKIMESLKKYQPKKTKKKSK